MSRCTSITKIKEVNGTDLLKVIIDENGNNTEAYWFYDYSKSLEFVDQDVIVDYRTELIEGEKRLTINTFTVPTQINTLSEEKDFKLFADAEDNFSNVSFHELVEGEVFNGAILYCIQHTYESSSKATWAMLLVRDKFMHVAKMRLFDYEDTDPDFSGSYVIADIKRTKYGLQAEMVNQAQGEVKVNPEITLARKYVLNYFANDQLALSVLDSTKLLDSLDAVVDYEKGYGVVRLAMELSLAHAMTNLTNTIDVKTIEHTILGSYLHFTKPGSILSPTVLNCMLGSHYNWPNKKDVILMLDIANEEKPKENPIYMSIKDMVSTILEQKKGVAF